jgi:hypothetical protein
VGARLAAEAPRERAREIRDRTIEELNASSLPAWKKVAMLAVFDKRAKKLRAAKVNWEEISQAERAYFSGE